MSGERIRALALSIVVALVVTIWAPMQVRAQASPFTLLHSFETRVDSRQPVGPLAKGPDGTLYGTTFGAGIEWHDWGSVYQISPGGGFQVLHRFDAIGDPANGYFPAAAVILGPTVLGTCRRVARSRRKTLRL